LTNPDRILLISDMHVGSLYGLMPPGFETKDPRNDDMIRFTPNRTQKQLWNHWLKMCKAASGVKAIIINGDVCDGPQRKSAGLYTWTSNMKFQAEAAILALESLPEAPMFFTQGSLYHAVEDRPIEQYIAERCGAEYGDDLLVNTCGIKIHASHHISSSISSWQYWTTAIARDLLLLALHGAEDKYGHVDVAVRSHRHTFTAAEFGSQIGIITPAWQTRNQYAVRKGIISPPDIGWVILEIHGPKRILVDRSGIANIGRPSRVVTA